MANTTFNFNTTAEQVASHHSSQITGKTILITGVSPGGLGLQTAKALALHSPGLLILAGRNSSTLSIAQSEVTSVAPNVPVKLLALDLSSISKVRSAAAEFNSWTSIPKLDILINNAGIMGTPEYKESEDGIESQFATNHLGPWLFTNLVMGKVVEAKGRVVFVSSIGHMYGGVRFEDWNFKAGKEYDADLAYGQSKTANILAAKAFAKKLRSKGVTAFSLHPGLILTNITRDVPISTLQAKGFLDADGNVNPHIPQKTFSQGTATTITAALDPDIVDKSGAYLSDCRVDHDDMYAEWAKDENGEGAKILWELSEKLVEEKFEY